MVRQLTNLSRLRGNGFEPVPAELVVDADIKLRRIGPENAADMDRLLVDNRSYLEPWFNPAVDDSLESAVSREERTRHLVQAGWMAPYGIVYKGGLNGEVELYRVDSLTAKMGYWRVNDGRREGVMARSAQKLVDFGFEAWGLRNILFDISDQNQPSMAVAQSIGASITESYFDRAGDNGSRLRINRWAISR